MLEIERKFLVSEMPDLSHIIPIKYERYFITDNGSKQIRVQKKDNKYELETKIKINEFEYKKTKKNITKLEFLNLSVKCNKSIIRDSYLICTLPNITIKKYFGDYDGLIRAEIEYNNTQEMQTFKLPDWLGFEITGTDLSNDNKLIKLTRDEFLKTLNDLTIKNNII